MILGCPSCGAQLRVKDGAAGPRARAKCPRCGGVVPLQPSQPEFDAAAAAIPRILVECGSCGARLKAPASSAGARSHCPKCRAEVVIRASESEPPAARAARAPSHRPEDPAGAATRRIDSRTLGLATAPGAAPAAAPASPVPGGVDLEAFIRTGAAAPPPPSSESAGMAAALLKPPVAEMEKIAFGMREAAESFPPAAPAATPAATAPRTSEPSAARAEPRTPVTEPAPAPRAAARHRTAETPAAPRPFPASRGLLFGTLAGALVGAASAAIAAMGDRFEVGGLVPADFLAPLPLAQSLPGIPDLAARVVLPLLLGAIAGFLSAAAGSPSRADRPLRLARVSGFALLAGLACGLVAALWAGTGLTIWPIASWMRDLLLAGALASTMNSLAPQPAV